MHTVVCTIAYGIPLIREPPVCNGLPDNNIGTVGNKNTAACTGLVSCRVNIKQIILLYIRKGISAYFNIIALTYTYTITAWIIDFISIEFQTAAAEHTKTMTVAFVDIAACYGYSG